MITFRSRVAPGDSTSRTCVPIVSGDTAEGDLTPSGSSRGRKRILVRGASGFKTELPNGHLSSLMEGGCGDDARCWSSSPSPLFSGESHILSPDGRCAQRLV